MSGAGESYTYCLEIDSDDYISVACLSDGRVYKIRDLMRKEMNVLSEKYKVPPDGFVGLELMHKPRFRSLHGITEAGNNKELFLGGFRGLELSFEACGDEGSDCIEVIVPADGQNIRLVREGKDVTTKWEDSKDVELMGAVFITYYEQYGQACSFFRLTVEDFLGGTGHGKRFLNRLLRSNAGGAGPSNTGAGASQTSGAIQAAAKVKPSAVALVPKKDAKDAKRPAPPPAPKTSAPSSQVAAPMRQKTPDSSLPDSKKAKVEATEGKNINVSNGAATKEAASAVAGSANATPSAPEGAKGAGRGGSSAPTPAGPISPFVALQLIQPFLDRHQVPKDVRWAMGQDLNKMPADTLATFMQYMNETIDKDDATSLSVLKFYFPESGL